MLSLIVLLAVARLSSGAFNEELNKMFLSMEHTEFVNHFNNLNLSWKKSYFKHDRVFHYNHNYIFNQDSLIERKYLDLNGVFLQANFDARVKWPHCRTIRQIHDQYNCDSCWTHGVANTASDRICIHLPYNNFTVDLSEQDLECAHSENTICNAGFPSKGFIYWKVNGIVTRNCKPYEPHDLNRHECVEFCKFKPKQSAYFNAKYYAESIYKIYNDFNQIRAELSYYGPIQATMRLYEDFQEYESGIYEHNHGRFLGYHSVRVIGYGVKNNTAYWIGANSWGTGWGENGFFRIKVFQEEIGFEDNLYSGLPRKTLVPTL